jgi:hypothetical protein
MINFFLFLFFFFKLAELSAIYLKKKYIDSDNSLARIPSEQMNIIINKTQNSIDANRNFNYIK